MNCDRVFDILTRGPFPTGHDSDYDVERHLSECPDCHRLAEALRPALELFEESIPLEEGRDLPGYWGELSPAPSPNRLGRQTQVAAPPAEPMTPRPPAPAPSLWQFLAQPASRVAAAVAAGVVLALLLRAAGLSETPAPYETAMVAPSGVEADASQVRPAIQSATLSPGRLLNAIQLSPACWGGAEGPATLEVAQLPAAMRHNQLRCCTNCHHQGHTAATPKEAIATVARACVGCHQVE
jgi:hypothetical protein